MAAADFVVGFDRPRIGRARHVVEMQGAIGIVLHDEDVAAGGPFEKPPPFFEPNQQTGRILKIRNDVEERNAPSRRALACQDAVEVLEVDDVVLLAHADERRLSVVKRSNGAGVRGQLDEYHVAGIDEHPRGQIERLLRARGDDDFVGGRSNAALGQNRGQRVDERAVPARGPVLQDARVGPVEHRMGDAAEFLPRKDVGRWKPGREGNHVGRSLPERTQLPNRRLLHVRGGAREEAVVVDHAGWPSAGATRDPSNASPRRAACPA